MQDTETERTLIARDADGEAVDFGWVVRQVADGADPAQWTIEVVNSAAANGTRQ